MATDAPTLLAAAGCYETQTPGQWHLLQLGLLQQLVLGLNPMADTSPAALLELSKCYQLYSPGLWPLFGLAMLQMLATGGLGGGGDSGAADPVDAPAGGNGTYYNTTTGSFWVWNPATSTWDQLIV